MLRYRFVGAMLLAGLLFATQSHHFMTAYHLPPAAFAVMYLAGFFLQRFGWWLLLAMVILLVDGLTIGLGQAQGAYFAWSYVFMFPAYAVMWLGGKWAAKNMGFLSWRSCLKILISFLSIVFAEFIASGSFYVLNVHGSHSMKGIIDYYNAWAYQSVESFLFWILPSMMVYVLVMLGHRNRKGSPSLGSIQN